MSFKFSFKSIEIGRLSQFERKVIPNGWRCDAKRALRCNRLSSWYLQGHPIAGSQRSTWQIVVNKITQIRWSRPPATIECEYSDLENDPLFDREPMQIPSGSLVTATTDLSSRGRLRSSNTFGYEIPLLKCKFSERRFSFAGPKAWNDLRFALQKHTDTCTFKRQLKTHLFTLAYTNCCT